MITHFFRNARDIGIFLHFFRLQEMNRKPHPFPIFRLVVFCSLYYNDRLNNDANAPRGAE